MPSVLRSLALALPALLGAVAFAPSLAAGQPVSPGLEAKVRAFDAYAARGVADWHVPGLAVAVVKDGRVVLARAYGVRELGRPEPATARTLFAIGSTTKAMTAAALAMLVDEGKLAWDDAVVRHLPGFALQDPWLTSQVTVRDLLTHRAGLPNTDFLWYRSGRSSQEVLRLFALVKPESSLRSRFRYQNVMYHAAGETVAAVSGRPWADFVRERIFVPLEMNDSVSLGASRAAGADVAAPHFDLQGTVKVIRNASVDNVAAAGSVWSSVSDMAKWLAFLLGGGRVGEKALLSEGSLREVFAPQAMVDAQSFYPTARLTRPHWTTYGLGWFQQDYAGEAVDFHTGSIDGMVAICGLLRDRGLGVVVLANLDHAELRHALMLRAFDTFGPAPAARAAAPRDWSAELLKLYAELRTQGKERGAKVEATRVADTRPTLPLDRYAGDYADPLYGQARVVTEGGGLRLVLGQERGGRLEHWNYDTFKSVPDLEWVDPVYVRFGLDAQGRVGRLALGDLTEPDASWASFARREEQK